jgi:hypothetical protein
LLTRYTRRVSTARLSASKYIRSEIYQIKMAG